MSATGFQFPIYESIASSEEYLATYENSKPSNYEVFLKSAAEQPAGTWMYNQSNQWKELSYDTLTANLLDSDQGARWTVSHFLDECRKVVDQYI